MTQAELAKARINSTLMSLQVKQAVLTNLADKRLISGDTVTWIFADGSEVRMKAEKNIHRKR
jgi:hypothetical protein